MIITYYYMVIIRVIIKEVIIVKKMIFLTALEGIVISRFGFPAPQDSAAPVIFYRNLRILYLIR